jgi:hypothetical protein
VEQIGVRGRHPETSFGGNRSNRCALTVGVFDHECSART